MFRRHLQLVVFAFVGFCLASAVPAAQKNKGGTKPPEFVTMPGTAVVRCMAESDPLPDVVCGDGSSIYVDSTLPGGDPGVTVQLRQSDGNFILRTSYILDPTVDRAHVVRIPGRATWAFNDCAPWCVAEIPDDGLVVYTEPDADANAFFGAAIDAGLASMQDGNTVSTVRLLMGFPDPDPASDIAWGLYWNPEYYQGTDYGTATRSGCTWTFSADANALAGLWLFKTGKGKYQNAQEGRFAGPVEVTFTADSSVCSLP